MTNCNRENKYGAYYWKSVLTITGKTHQKRQASNVDMLLFFCSLSKTNAELHTQKSLIMSGQSNTTIRLSKDDTSDDDQNQPTTIRV